MLLVLRIKNIALHTGFLCCID